MLKERFWATLNKDKNRYENCYSSTESIWQLANCRPAGLIDVLNLNKKFCQKMFSFTALSRVLKYKKCKNIEEDELEIRPFFSTSSSLQIDDYSSSVSG